MDLRNKYADPRPPPAKLKSSITPIGEVPTFAVPMGILRTLETGDEGLQRQLDVLRLAAYVGDADKLSRDPRKNDIKDRLSKLKATATQPAATAAKTGHPAAVAAGLELLRAEAPRVPHRTDRRALVAQLEDGRQILRAAIIAQHEVVDQIRDRLSMELAQKLQKQHTALVVAQFRAAQQLAHATDQLRALHRSVAESGYTARADLLQGTPGRACLILGSESDRDSEVSRMRIMLEDLGAL